jgi:Ca2+-binding RTX toxin-like protein
LRQATIGLAAHPNGTDVTIGVLGNDTFVGGDGFDTVDFNGAQKAVTVDLAAR